MSMHPVDPLWTLQQESFARGGEAIQKAYPPERRLTEEQLVRFVDGHEYAVAATTRAGGRAHAAPTLYYRSGTEFWLPTMAGTVRARNVERNGWVSLVIDEGEGDHHIAVLTEGPAETVQPNDAPAQILTNRTSILDSWLSCWLKVSASRLFSYAEPGAAG